MYRHSQLGLGLGLSGSVALHLGGAGTAWAALLGATVLGMLLSASNVAVELGVPHVTQLFDLLRGRGAVAPKILPCPHCGKAHT